METLPARCLFYFLLFSWWGRQAGGAWDGGCLIYVLGGKFVIVFNLNGYSGRIGKAKFGVYLRPGLSPSPSPSTTPTTTRQPMSGVLAAASTVSWGSAIGSVIRCRCCCCFRCCWRRYNLLVERRCHCRPRPWVTRAHRAVPSALAMSYFICGATVFSSLTLSLSNCSLPPLALASWADILFLFEKINLWVLWQ